MSINQIQAGDGSLVQRDDSTGIIHLHIGGNTPALQYRMPRIVRIPFAAVDTAGGVFSWQNSSNAAVVITRAIVDMTTKTTAACTLSIGPAANATTLNATLIDTLDIGTAAGTFDNITDKGTNGKSRQRVAALGWVTGSVQSGASAGGVGVIELEFSIL